MHLTAERNTQREASSTHSALSAAHLSLELASLHIHAPGWHSCLLGSTILEQTYRKQAGGQKPTKA